MDIKYKHIIDVNDYNILRKSVFYLQLTAEYRRNTNHDHGIYNAMIDLKFIIL